MTAAPRVAVLLDENTSGGGTRYEAAKGYFAGVVRAGAAAYGLPYEPAMVEDAVRGFDALLTCGGRFAMPAEWYAGEAAPSPPSDRLAVEMGLVRGFLAAGKPVLGLCAGMQVMAALSGARLNASVPDHNDRERRHLVRTRPGSRLAALTGEAFEVNTFHNEALAETGEAVACAWADDGVIEAIELPGEAFAIGVQWHQELLGPGHPGEGLFRGLVDACRTPG